MTATDETTGLLQEWAIQIDTLLNAPDQAYQAMSQIHTTFGELHMRLSEAGELDTAELVIGAYNHATMIYQQGQIYEQALTLGKGVVTDLTQQRDDTMRELSGLMEAIQRGSEAHPALMDYAETIRAEEREAVLDSEDYLEDATDLAKSSLRIRIFTTFRRNGIGGGGQHLVSLMLTHLMGERQMDHEQLTALRAFLDTLS